MTDLELFAKKVEFVKEVQRIARNESKRSGFVKCVFCESGHVIYRIKGCKRHIQAACTTRGCLTIIL
jgi:hypothetical protein